MTADNADDLSLFQHREGVHVSIDQQTDNLCQGRFRRYGLDVAGHDLRDFDIFKHRQMALEVPAVLVRGHINDLKKIGHGNDPDQFLRPASNRESAHPVAQHQMGHLRKQGVLMNGHDLFRHDFPCLDHFPPRTLNWVYSSD